MQNNLNWILAITKSEYNGNSFNGPNLIKTLKSLSFNQVISTDTFENYSVWSIVLHLMKWKHQLAEMLGALGLAPFLYKGDNFPELLELLTEQTWNNILVELDSIHNAYIKTLKEFDSTKLDEKMEWGCSFGEAVAWMTTHDTYHNAQIRNMGLEIKSD